MRLLRLVFACSLLAACNMSGQRGGKAPMAIYDFGPLPVESVKPGRQALALEVRAPLWFDSQGIGYRLLYADAARLHEYTRARWAGPVAQMIEQRMVRRLGLSMAGQGRARCIIRIEIAEFSQSFATPDSSRGLLRARVALLDLSRRELAERAVNIEMNAVTADARGGVGALTAAVDQLADDLMAWDRLPDSRASTGCAG
jgi:cholesterol transport system auxiliary component